MNDDIGRQFLQRLEVVPQRLLDEMPLLHAGCAHVSFEQLAGRPGYDCGYLSFSFHD